MTVVCVRQCLRQLARRRMSTVQINRFGDPKSVLSLEPDDNVSSPGHGQVAVKMQTAVISPADLWAIRGAVSPGTTLPRTAGLEGCGEVTAVGPGVSGLSKGDRVVPTSPGLGTWRSVGKVESQYLTKVPSHIPVDTAALLTHTLATAHRLLADFVELKQGDVVLQSAAESLIGQAVTQLAKTRGLETVNVASNAKAQTLLKGLGTPNVVTVAELRGLKGKSPAPSLCLDSVGGSVGSNLAKALKFRGTFVYYGGPTTCSLPIGPIIFNDITARGFSLVEWSREHSTEEHNEMIQDLATVAREFQFHNLAKFQLSSLHEALARVTTNDAPALLAL